MNEKEELFELWCNTLKKDLESILNETDIANGSYNIHGCDREFDMFSIDHFDSEGDLISRINGDFHYAKYIREWVKNGYTSALDMLVRDVNKYEFVSLVDKNERVTVNKDMIEGILEEDTEFEREE